ncbi:MAG TPA: DsbA family protein [Thermodesulfobacteriota bacterium]|nr:DsbA family protein [Thermodesulfobacteriota bacterium]
MKPKLIVFSDYICPFCFFALKMVEKLQAEYVIEVEWKNYEIHPDIPKNGASKSFLGENYLKTVEENMRLLAELEKLEVKSNSFISNSHLALESSEFAKEKGVFGSFHKKVFEAYFMEGRNIGDKSVILDIAQGLRLDPDDLSSSLDEHRYHGRLLEVRMEKTRLGVIGTPTFIVGKRQLAGLPSYDVLRQFVEPIMKRGE